MKNNCKRLPKWSRNRFQNASKINARTGFRKMREIIKNHVSLKSKIIEIHCKNLCFWWFRRLHVRMVKVAEKHQKLNQHPSEIQWKIDTKIMFLGYRFCASIFSLFSRFYTKKKDLGTPPGWQLGPKWHPKSPTWRHKASKKLSGAHFLAFQILVRLLDQFLIDFWSTWAHFLQFLEPTPIDFGWFVM